jgi:hypothetical protein
LLRLAEEDLLSLKLRHADQLRANGQITQSRAVLDEIVEKYAEVERYQRWVRLAQQALAALPTDNDEAKTEDSSHSRSP